MGKVGAIVAQAGSWRSSILLAMESQVIIQREGRDFYPETRALLGAFCSVSEVPPLLNSSPMLLVENKVVLYVETREGSARSSKKSYIYVP